MNTSSEKAITTRELYFDCNGPGSGRLVATGAEVSVHEHDELNLLARRVDGGRALEALVTADDYRAI